MLSPVSAIVTTYGLLFSNKGLMEIAALRANPHQSYLQLLNSVRAILREKYSQRPQLSSSHPIDVNLQFIC